MEVFMKSLFASILLAGMALALSGANLGCSASAGVEPDRSRPAGSRDDDRSYKKTEVRDANGNVIERRTETRNP
jgi:hypothetical protein